MNNLIPRILTAIILIILVLVLIFKTSIIWLLGLVILLVSFGLFELLKLAKPPLLPRILTVILVVIFSVSGLLIQPFSVLIFGISGIWWLQNIWTISNYPQQKPLAKLFPLNAGLLLSPAFGLIHLYLQDVNLLILLLLIVWAADSFAYLFGNVFGKHKLAEKVSSGKTIEGVFGGVFGALSVTGIWMLAAGNSDWRLLIIALISAIFSVAGDLYISIYKREAGVKNSGKILPGHGGVLDRIDGLLAATPIFVIGIFLL